MADGLPVYMRARCKTGIVASKLTRMAHMPREFRVCFHNDEVTIRANFMCRSVTTRGVVLSSWSDAEKVCAICEDAAKGPSVYRCLDFTGYPVYIGSSRARLWRLQQHEWKSPWWPEVVETTAEHFPTLAEARAAERMAILTEHPLYNSLHNGQYGRAA